ncbi:sugar phosphate nucleotidyltransferase, partial [Christensenella hongkongensis]
MFKKRKCVAMLLAGGQGSRLGVLTKHRAKPAVTYGGKYRIIDFPLSNCVHSGIDTVGVLTQYEPLELNAYIGTGAPWDLDGITGGAFVLPPYVKGERGEWYTGTANAIYQNIYFIEQYNPDYILVLSGDHIYKMDYSQMISAHEANKADATIAVIEVPMEEASRFGIMNADETLRINEFEEKPKKPKSNMASMGVYVFSWQKIREYLVADSKDEKSSNDFGKNIIPKMLDNGERLFA